MIRNFIFSLINLGRILISQFSFISNDGDFSHSFNRLTFKFFKTFILPYFDYCLSLLIYFPKSTIQRLSNCFNLCLYKLFNFKLLNVESDDLNNLNNQVESYGLFSY